MIIPSRCPGVTVRQYRCTSCGCHVNPTEHVSDSAECVEAERERYESRSQ